MNRRLPDELAAFSTQAVTLADWVGQLPDDALARASVLPGWDLRTLIDHVADATAGLPEALLRRSAGAARPLSEHVRSATPPGTEQSTGEGGEPSTREQVVARLRTPVPDSREMPDSTVIDTPRGAVTVLDLLRLRVIGVVVHCDDVSRSVPAREPVPLTRPALASAVRTLAEILAGQAPGRSVEVRVPPFVAVQAVPGPRHTRGTPPNVVETDPLTWLRLATGRVAFADATARGDVRATGPRSDLGEHLPVLR